MKQLAKWLALCLWQLLPCAVIAQTLAQSPACPPAPPVMTSESAAQGIRGAKDKGFLYAFSKNGQTSWLFGTMHIGNEATLFQGRV